MVCIYCNGKTQIINSRLQRRVNNTWRRRQCKECGAIFTTIEVPDLLRGILVINGKDMEPFSRDNLFLSLYDCLKHRKTAQQDATGLTDTIIGHLYSHINVGVVQRNDIVKVAVLALKRFDKVAEVHYSAFHSVKAAN